MDTLLEKLTVTLAATALLTLVACGDDSGGGQGNADTGVSPDTRQADTGTPDAASDASPDTGGPDDTGVDDSDTDDFTFDTERRDTGSDGDAGLPDLELASLTPRRGPVEGGTQFVLKGQGFTQKTVVYFGSRKAEVELVDDTLVGQTPEGPSEGAVAVKALDPETGEDVIQDGFEYTESLVLSSASPDRIPTDGGAEIELTGSGFSPETRVSFDGRTARRHTHVDSGTMRVVAPEGDAGPADVRLTNRDASTVAEKAVSYFQTLAIDSVRPAGGPTAGGTTVDIEGDGFESGMTVRFGAETATVQSVNSAGDTATVVTPAVRNAGLVDVTVENQAGDAELASDAFYYRNSNSEFTVASVEPDVARESGNVDVTLVGAGLDRSGLQVEFGSKSATIVSAGSGHAVVTVPAHAPGTVDVTVRDGQGASSTLSQAFRYVGGLGIDSASPAEGKAAGGTQVTLKGEGFENASKVLFGGIPAQFSVKSDGQMTVTTPKHAAGEVDIVVERGDVEARLKNGFTYTEQLQVFGLSPVRGSIAGNTYVEVRGRGFVGENMGVKFGQKDGTSVEILDTQTLAVRTPEHKPDSVDVQVSRGQNSVTSDTQFTFFNPGARNGGTWGGPVQGAVNVSVFSQGGSPIPNAFVMLSTDPETTYKGKTNADGLVTLSGPDVYGDQTITAVAPNYSSTTIQHVDAENITIFLSPPSSNGPPGPGPPTATYRGTISGLNKIAEPGPDEFHMAMVFTTKKSPWSRQPDPGDGNIVMADGPYTLNTRIGDLALVAMGGLYNSKTEEFTPLRMGVKRFQYAADGKVYKRDIDLNIPLSSSLRFKLKNPPAVQGQTTRNRVVPYLDFGFEGVFGDVVYAEGTDKVLEADHLPALAGELSDVKYMAVGGVYTKRKSGELGSPQSIAIKRDITSTTGIVEMPTLLGVANITSPGAGQQPVNGVIQFKTGNGAAPDFWYAQVLTGLGGTVWDAFIPGAERTIQLPEFPDFSDYPADMRPEPYPGGGYRLAIFGIRHPGVDYRNFTYADLSIDKWEAYSVGAQVIKFGP